jgi:hypothetical protein
MPPIFRYFWFVCAAFMLMNIVIWRGRLAALIDRGVVGRDEAKQITRWTTGWLVGGPCVLGLIGVAANWSSPFCAGFLQFGSTPQAVTSLVTIAGWSSLLWWVWRGRGAAFLARVGPALSARPSHATYPPQLVRLAITALVLVSAIGGAVAWRAVPTSPALTCPASTVAA